MTYLECVRTLSGKALYDFAHMMYENDPVGYYGVITDLVRSGAVSDSCKIADIMSAVPLDGTPQERDYYEARTKKGGDVNYLQAFFHACKRCALSEEEYIRVLLAAPYAEKDSALAKWNDSIDLYLTRRANEDFDLIADYIDKYDGKFHKYGVLMEVDGNAATTRLLNKVLYQKNTDKTAVRNALMNHSEIAEVLFARYSSAQAKERAAIARLLAVFKNDEHVRAFLDGVVATDPSKTVRSVLDGVAPKKRGDNAVAYLENMMAEGSSLTYAEWKELLKDEKYALVADRIFFYTVDDDGARVFAYDNGRFLDTDDNTVEFADSKPIYVLHPLDTPSDAKHILKLNISQPFLQIQRPTFGILPNESYYSYRLSGTMIFADEFERNLKKYGFVFSSKNSDREEDIAVCRIGEYMVGVECRTTVGSDAVCCGHIMYYSAADAVRLKRNVYISSAQPLDVRNVPRREFSELTYAAVKLFGG